MKDRTPTARKVPKGQVSWERVKRKKSTREKSYEAKVGRESKGPTVLTLMKTWKFMFTFASLFAILTVLALIIEPLRYIFPLSGIVIMIVAYFLGGGLSEWHSVPPTTTIGAKSMLSYRYGGSSSNWDMITIGLIIGGIIFLSGVLSILIATLY
ncbi:MAG: hypothetical protein KAR39_00970 [Thermoplasmata archaeon]|nr:hypothetical protein [Thermoplasmata archaeon]